MHVIVLIVVNYHPTVVTLSNAGGASVADRAKAMTLGGMCSSLQQTIFEQPCARFQAGSARQQHTTGTNGDLPRGELRQC